MPEPENASATNVEQRGTSGGALLQPSDVRGMFDRIVRRYDLMNRLMTGGRDVAWRREAARMAIGSGAERALDVATGTGDLALELRRRGVPDVTGLDFSREMLASAEIKAQQQRVSGITFLQGDAMSMPFPDASFDALTIAWGLRNLPDYERGIQELARVLRPEGRMVILEMTPLQNPALRKAFNLYFQHAVPVIGGVISGDRDAYRYLPDSVGAFPPADDLAGMMRATGLRNVRYKLVGGGTVALHIGIRD
jgi:demethylmenaquinone methyltransferase / 2-methoxy-6-polyprenyl-1,4-benzoquinol methylase